MFALGSVRLEFKLHIVNANVLVLLSVDEIDRLDIFFKQPESLTHSLH